MMDKLQRVRSTEILGAFNQSIIASVLPSVIVKVNAFMLIHLPNANLSYRKNIRKSLSLIH